MNRRAIRDLAAKELGLRTAKYFYAKTFEEFKNAADEIGFPMRSETSDEFKRPWSELCSQR